MAMKINVVWTMGSGIPIAADRVVTEAGACYSAAAQRLAFVGRGGGAAMRTELLATVSARGRPLTAGKKGCKGQA